MAHTYWDPKGMVKKRPGGYTYHGGNTRLSDLYKERFLPHYDKKTGLSTTDQTDTLAALKRSTDYNTYQKRTWYQDNLDRNTKPEFKDFPGTHAEWRKVGEFEKSSQKYTANTVYDYQVNVKTTDADGFERIQQVRTADHTQAMKLRRDMEERERYDIQDRNSFALDEIGREMSRPGTASIVTTVAQSNFNRSGGSASSSVLRPSTVERHPAVNPSLCSEHPKETFRKNNRQTPLFGATRRKYQPS